MLFRVVGAPCPKRLKNVSQNVSSSGVVNEPCTSVRVRLSADGLMMNAQGLRAVTSHVFADVFWPMAYVGCR